MAMTFDATLKDMGRESPQGFLAAFDRPPTAPVHSVIILLRPGAAHSNLNGAVRYSPRPERGKMDFAYEIVRLWERPAEQLLAADLGVTPLAVLGRLRMDVQIEDALAGVVQQLVTRLTEEAPPDLAARLKICRIIWTRSPTWPV